MSALSINVNIIRIGAFMTPFRRIAQRVLPAVLAAACVAAPAVAAAQASTSPRPAAAIPAGFIAQSTSWISPSQGWILGTTACGKNNCAKSEVLSTTNGGSSWKQIGTISAMIPRAGNPGNGMSEIRFANASVGWAFAPDLYRTSNGGATWRKVQLPGGGKQVLDLAVTRTQAYAVISPCAYETGICGGGKPLTAWRISVTASTTATWTKMPVALHANVAANVAAFGNTVYVVNSRLDGASHPSQLYVSTNGGATFASRPIPCDASTENNLIQAAPYSATGVGLLCDGDPGFSKAVKTVYLSTNNGKTDTNAGTLGLFGIQAQLAISPTRKLAVQSESDGSFIYINDNNQSKWYMIIGSGDGGAGFNDLTYVSGNDAWVVYGPANGFSGYGQMYKTTNAGRHWVLEKL
jgi:photosystem II stability/assembly factor-like uncharacterized protein